MPTTRSRLIGRFWISSKDEASTLSPFVCGLRNFSGIGNHKLPAVSFGSKRVQTKLLILAIVFRTL